MIRKNKNESKRNCMILQKKFYKTSQSLLIHYDTFYIIVIKYTLTYIYSIILKYKHITIVYIKVLT